MVGHRFRGMTGLLAAGIAAALAASLAFAGGAAADDARVSIVGGKTTTIAKNPWQVAFLTSPAKAPGKSPRERLLCGGSLVAPTMIITAGHCAALIDISKPEYFSVIAGRTRLNDTSSGQEVLTSDVFLPTARSGVPHYLLGPQWDVALVELAEPVASAPIQLLGPDEAGLIEPGRPVIKTGWGVTRPRKKRPKASNVLMEARTAIQPGGACGYLAGSGPFGFETDTQLCLGDLRGRQGGCFGDSGGPTVVATSAGFRLIGATSYGVDGYCSPGLASVDSALGRPDPRDWLAGLIQAETGTNPVGAGGAAVAPLPPTCTMAKVLGLKLRAARKEIRAGGCRIGKVKYVRLPPVKLFKRYDGKVLETYPSPHMLFDPQRKVKLLVGKQLKKKNKQR